ncbi:MAG: sigma-70 family RNA polymerase sigma factor [Flavobacteriaceae bacterium]|nr:MAG: sigma-70 family RNA polymerase sigma factor [Flavobacteriaceae bacterium]
MSDTLTKQQKDSIFEDEFFPHIDALYTFAFHLTYNDADANDLVQETYLKAYRFVHSYERGTNAKAWLFKILKNAFINEYRKRSKQPSKIELSEVINYQDADTNQSPSFVDLREEVFSGLIGDEVTNAVNNLPVDFRTVVLLCDVEGFSYEEISKIMDIPIGTVRSRLHRARNMLKEVLIDYAKKLGFKEKR